MAAYGNYEDLGVTLENNVAMVEIQRPPHNFFNFALIGAIGLGGLADSYGRRRMFVVEMLVFAVFLVGLAWSPSLPWLVVFLFGVGLALGCDYPTAHLIISESIASRDRGKLVLSAFAFQAVGALVGTMVGYLILANVAEISAWRWMYATAIVPAIAVVIDDMGVDRARSLRIVDLPGPLTLSLMTYADSLEDLAARARRAGASRHKTHTGPSATERTSRLSSGRRRRESSTMRWKGRLTRGAGSRLGSWWVESAKMLLLEATIGPTASRTARCSSALLSNQF